MGNVLPEVSGEISTDSVLAAGTGTHQVVEEAIVSAWRIDGPRVSRHVVRRR